MAYPNGVSVRAAGAAWDPMRRTWRELPGSPVVALNAQAAPVWTGSEVAVVSRSLPTDPPDGVPPDSTYVSLYDPAANSWRVAGIQDVYLPTGPAVAIGPLVVSRDAIYNVLTDTWLEPPAAPEGAWVLRWWPVTRSSSGEVAPAARACSGSTTASGIGPRTTEPRGGVGCRLAPDTSASERRPHTKRWGPHESARLWLAAIRPLEPAARRRWRPYISLRAAARTGATP